MAAAMLSLPQHAAAQTSSKHQHVCMHVPVPLQASMPGAIASRRCKSKHAWPTRCKQQYVRLAVLVAAQPDDSGQQGHLDQTAAQQLRQQPTPTLMDGVNWYCYTALGLLFLTDFTPVGQWLLSSSATGSAAARLALLQWGAFVLPSLLWVRQKGWNVRGTLKLNAPADAKQWLIGLAVGPVLWALINIAIAIKTGNTQTLFAAANVGAGSSGSSPGVLLLGGGSDAAVALQQLPLLLLSAAVSPAVAEELLFRGLLMTALQERLGKIDAVAVAAALFALIHLDPQQFFLYCVLGGACGAVTLASGSVGPAVLLHCSFNAAAVAAGWLVTHS